MRICANIVNIMSGTQTVYAFIKKGLIHYCNFSTELCVQVEMHVGLRTRWR